MEYDGEKRAEKKIRVFSVGVFEGVFRVTLSGLGYGIINATDTFRNGIQTCV